MSIQRSPFGTLLRCRREEAHLSRATLATLAKLSEATIKFIETDRTTPSNPRPLPNHQMFLSPRSVRYQAHHYYWPRSVRFLVAECLKRQIEQTSLLGLRRRHDSHRSERPPG